MKHHLLAIIVMTGSLLSPAAARAVRPMTLEAEAWIERAIAEFPAAEQEERSVKGPPTTFDKLASQEMLSEMLFEIRRTEADRNQLLEAAHRREKTPPANDSLLERFNPLGQAASMYAWAGAKDDARRLLPAVEKIAAEAKPAEGFPGLEYIVIEGLLAAIHMRLGDLADAELNRLGSRELMSLMFFAAGDDNSADTARYAALALGADADPKRKGSSDTKALARALAMCGQITAAHEAANRLSAKSGERARVLAEIAAERRKAGDLIGAMQDLRLALDAARVTDDTKRGDALFSVLSEAYSIGGTAMIEASADALSDELSRPRPPGVGDNFFYQSTLARGYAAAGRQEKFSRAVAAAEALMGRVREQDQAERWVQVAEAYARADDKAKVDTAMSRAKAVDPAIKFGHLFTEYVSVAYAQAGDFKNAMETVRTYVSAEGGARASALTSIAALQATTGHFTDAEQTAAGLDDPWLKLKIDRRIVVERIKAKQTSGLVEWIAAHRSSRERAVLYLAAAQQLMGREGRDMTLIFHVRP